MDKLNKILENIAEHRAVLDSIKTAVAKIDKDLNGNGSPGIILKVDRLEQRSGKQVKINWFLFTSFVGFLLGATLVLLRNFIQ